MKSLYSIIISAAFCMALTDAQAADPLPALGASPSSTSVSGLSSGAFMAVQYQVAYSASIVGSGAIAGGPYYCSAEAGLSYALICMGHVPYFAPNANVMWGAAQSFGSDQIDSLSNLKHAKIYLFSGTDDTVVLQPAVDATATFFQLAGVPSANLNYVNNIPSGHALITPNFGNLCSANDAPYISHCKVNNVDYDQPGALLAHIYGTMNPAAKKLSGKIVTFNQSEFTDSAAHMASTAYAYIPAVCTKGTACKVHVAFHGCKQSAEVVQDDFYANTSYNSWADSNDMIVLYPQVYASPLINPEGCWDWWGYTGENYAWKTGPQLSAVRKMIERLTSTP